MKSKLIFQKIALVIAAENHNPTILNPDFLVRNEIIPEKWELAESPLCAMPVARTVYENGVLIESQFARIIFKQDMTGKSLDEVLIPQIAIKYCEVLPHVDYRAVGINPSGYVQMPSRKEAEKFLLNVIVKQGPWGSFLEEQPTVAISFKYPINDGVFTISIDDKVRSQSEGADIPVLTFSSNFHRDISSMVGSEKITRINEIISSWKKDIVRNSDFIEGSFLSGEDWS